MIEEKHSENNSVPQFLYRYRSVENFFLDELENNYLFFSDWEELNDPFEGQISISLDNLKEGLLKWNKRKGFLFSNDVLKKISEDPKTFIPFFELGLGTLIKKVNVCCFSKKNDSLLMWAHYANSHKGICVEFDHQQDKEAFINLTPVRYQKDYLQFNLLDDIEEMRNKLFSCKSEDWMYEEEYRLLNNEMFVKNYYNPQTLKSVIFGCRTPEESIQNVKKILRNHTDVSFKRCIPDRNSYKLNIVDCNS